MNYRTLVNQFTQDGYLKKLAASIKSKMSELRKETHPEDARRWIWELIQNGKDARYRDRPFRAAVDFHKNKDGKMVLTFQHNGQPFSVKNITYLVEQVSSKDQELEADGSPRNTGKFGSGFMTTHLLSEKVTLETVVKGEGLEHKKCTIELDRSPRDEGGIIESIRRSLAVLENLDELPDCTDFDPDQFNTMFRYEVTEKKIAVAETGLRDLDQAIYYTLIFIPAIEAVSVEPAGITYRLRKDLTRHQDNITFYTLEKEDIFDTYQVELLAVKGRKVQIVMPITREGDILQISPLPADLPKLFCDFPLIGTEDFPFPVVVNSPFFDLNDPRSIVRLTDVEEPEIEENKALMEEAVQMYQALLNYSAQNGIAQLFHLVKGNTEMDVVKDWISPTWHKAAIAEPIYETLTKAAIIDTELGYRKAIQDDLGQHKIGFPVANSAPLRTAIYDLSIKLYPQSMPRRSEIHDWHAVLWPKCLKLTLKRLSSYVVEFKSLKKLHAKLGESEDAIGWLNAFYDLLNIEGVVIKNVISNEIAVLPDQNGDFKIMRELYFDGGIPDFIKEIFLLLGDDLRSRLRSRDIYTANAHDGEAKVMIAHSIRKPAEVYTLLNKHLKEAKAEMAFAASLRIVQIFCDNPAFPPYRSRLFDAANRLYPEQALTKIKIAAYDATLFEQANQILLDNLVVDIARTGNLKQFAKDYDFASTEDALAWLASFVTLLLEMKQEGLLNDIAAAILPNQHGVFRVKEALSAGLHTDEVLKNISAKLGHDFRDDLIDPDISLTFANVPVDNRFIAEKIATLAGNLMADMAQDEDTVEAFQQLFNWFNLNPQLAEDFFGELYRQRHRLCSPENIVASLETNAKVQAAVKAKGFDSVEELLAAIDKVGSPSDPSPLTAVTQDILVSLGISNYKEFKVALEDKDLETLFGHNSVPSEEYFIFAQTLIERSQQRVIAFLESQGYDFSGAERTATTIHGGVVKNGGQPFDVVIRPGHKNEVIFYYGSEKQTLETPTSELWVDRGSGDPLLFTLGRLLRVNNITKVIID